MPFLVDFPQQLSEFVPDLNPGLDPRKLSLWSNKKAWWKCLADPNHLWFATVGSRLGSGSSCPYCSGKKFSAERSLAAVWPDLAAEWHPTKNDKAPSELMSCCAYKAWWKCKSVPGHEWEANINTRVSMKVGCPYCSGKRISCSNALAKKNPELEASWDKDKNSLRFDSVSYGSGKAVWWKCESGHGWSATVSSRVRGRGCPYCAGNKTDASDSLLTQAPLVASEWSDKNTVKPDEVLPGSGFRAWWRCSCGLEWEATVKDRVGKSSGCPRCWLKYPGLEKVASELLGVEKFGKTVPGTDMTYRPDFQLSDTVYLNVDGAFWHDENHRGRHYHLKIRKDFEARGLRLLQFYEDEIKTNPKIVKSITDAVMGRVRVKIHARKTEVVKVDHAEAREFLEANHLMGSGYRCRYLGLKNPDGLMQILGFRIRGRELEIVRSAGLIGVIVMGGFQKLLSAAIGCWAPASVVTFCDRRYTDGHSLIRAGFVEERTYLQYQYCKNKLRVDKRTFRALAGVGEEREALSKGWVRIYGAGITRYRLRF